MLNSIPVQQRYITVPHGKTRGIQPMKPEMS